MEVVFFIYGLSFFILGLAILVYPKKPSDFKLAPHLNLLAGFGLTHGLNEWFDLFIVIEVPKYTYGLEVARMIAMPVSFLFLVEFGVRAIAESNSRYKPLRALPVLLTGVWLAIFLLHPNHMLMGDVWGRYLICLPGTMLTAYALTLHRPYLRAAELKPAAMGLTIAAGTFVAYGIFAGAIVKDAGFWPTTVINYDNVQSLVGLPVQIFRTACAIVLACCTLRMLSIFHWETRKNLRESQLRFQTVAQAAPVILFTVDRDNRISFVQGMGLKALDITAEQLVGSSPAALFPELSPEDPKHSCLSEDSACNCNVTANDATFELCYSPLRDAAGEPDGAIGIALNVTARLKAQAELDQYRLQMVRTQRLTELGTMGTTMAARISKPLNVTQLLLRRLLSQVNDPGKAEAATDSLQQAFTEIADALAVLDRFCEFAQIAPLQHARPIDLYELGRKVTSAFAESARQVNLDIVLDHLDTVCDIYVAHKEVEYVFFMMIQHAIERADPAAHQSLTIRCEANTHVVRLHFANTCGHIDPDDMKKVFEPFAASDGADTGTDLGLAVIKQIVEAHNGTIEAVNEPSDGMTFCVTLPIKT